MRRIASTLVVNAAASVRNDSRYQRETGGYNNLKLEMTKVIPWMDAPATANGGATTQQPDVASSAADPLLGGLRNVDPQRPYRVTWFDESVSPAKRFAYWAVRRLREIPPDWRRYYHRFYRQEMAAGRYQNRPWERFLMVVEAYHKAKYVLRKYNVPIDESLIPAPYNNFWTETTYEERAWAHRRSTQMKELQALQREDEPEGGALMYDLNDIPWGAKDRVDDSRSPLGSPVHSQDLDAPRERELRMSDKEEMEASVYLGTVEDDKFWNPVLKQRRARMEELRDSRTSELEDDDDVDLTPTKGRDQSKGGGSDDDDDDEKIIGVVHPRNVKPRTRF